jgi:hypothetical protein
MRFASALLFCLVLFSTVARADGGRLAIVNLRVELADAERAQVRATIEGAIKKAGLDLVPELHVQHMQNTAPELFNCFTEDRCRVDLGQRLLADYLLTGSIGKEDDAYVVQLDIFDVQLATVKREPAACPRCSAQAFDKRLAAVVENGVRAARQLPRGTLIVRTRPPGAEVKLDQRPVGMSNLELVVAAGTHTVELGGAGRSPISMPIEVKAKERSEVDLKMTVQEGPLPSPPTPPTAKHPEQPQPPLVPLQPPTARRSWWRPQRIAGVALVAGGAALALSSIAPFVLDSDCSTEGHCYYQRHTQGAGIGLAVAGAAVFVAGVIVILTTPREHVQAALAPMVSPNSAGVVGVIRF